MAVNEILTARVHQALKDARAKKVEKKKMFSGIAFMVNNKLCIAVRGDNIMLRIEPALHDELVTKPGCHPMIMKGKDLKSYVVVEEAALADKKQLHYWVQLALDYNPAAKASVKKKKL